MNEELLSEAEVRAMLAGADSERKFFPAGFDILAEYAKAQALARELARVTQLPATTEDPSGFQDGSLFTRILLQGKHAEPIGQVLLSSFGHLATLDEVEDVTARKIVKVLRARGYVYIPIEQLETAYSGRFEVFRGGSWLARYFSSFYIIDPT